MTMIKTDYDVIVIGGGHAGCEAASAAARIGAQTLLLTQKLTDIGTLSCNPAIGGLARGHLVREVDALGGMMGRCIDQSGIHFRLLNRSRGPAVQSPRAQADRKLYQSAAYNILNALPNLALRAGKVMSFKHNDDIWTVSTDTDELHCKAVVLTTGTFLNGMIHFGDVSRSAGRIGDDASNSLAACLLAMSLPMARLKTGTPPRILKNSINFETLERQAPDAHPTPFSYLTDKLSQTQVDCFLTHTNEATHDIIRDDLHRSAMHTGSITGTSVRYCPSIEDKVSKFSDRDRHQVFLEPEGYDSDLIYPNGISNSLPRETQDDLVRSIAGLEDAVIAQPGYAVEYDYVDPRCLRADLNVAGHDGLYFAGQVNGTTGYEEAAAQGVIAGFNAALSCLGKEPFILSRTDALMGVLIDDLTTQGVTEPYRMFTSRAEFRLMLRADNADLRLTEKAQQLGAIGTQRMERLATRQTSIANSERTLHEQQIPLRTGDLDTDMKRLNAELNLRDIEFDEGAFVHLHTEDLYRHHIKRLEREIKAIKAEESRALPLDLDPYTISGLSTEICEKLTQVKPGNLSEASRIAGMTPSALARLYHHARALDKVS